MVAQLRQHDVALRPANAIQLVTKMFNSSRYKQYTEQVLVHGIRHVASWPAPQMFNSSSLILLSGDIEVNPGPGCPCGENIRSFLITCVGCNAEWHTECVGLAGLTEAPLRKITNWNCALFITLPDNIKKYLIRDLCPDAASLITRMEAMETRLNEKIDKIAEDNKANNFSAVATATRNINSKVSATNKMMKIITTQIENSEENQGTKMEIDERTLLIRNYRNKDISNSMKVRKVMMAKYPGKTMVHARTTAGGSIRIEFDTKETADEVKASWKKDLFGGNDGAFKASEQSHLGIIKHVYQDRTEDEIKKEITDVFPDAKCDFFKNDDGFMGIIKIKFKTEQQFEAAKQNKIKIFEQIYHVEKYKSKRRVIRCMNCQRFGHIQRLCRQENPICAKCTSEDHETRDCVVLEAEYKCHHCGGNHETGNKRCQVMIDKLEELTNA